VSSGAYTPLTCLTSRGHLKPFFLFQVENMKELTNNEKLMTTKEVADVLGVSTRVISKHANRLGITKNGIKTFYNQEQITMIKQAIEKSGRNDLEHVCKVSNISTDYEMMQKLNDCTVWLKSKIEQLGKQLQEEQRKNAILMHVSKTYTITEIAKEIGMKSAIELNIWLADKKIQYKVNDTWVPYSEYANLGYFEIKQEVLENGHVIYNRRVTQEGRAFILELSKNGGK